MKACSVYYLFSQMSLSDWLVFSRRFGSALAAFQSDAAPDSEKWNDMAEALANIDNESSFMYGTGDKLELIQVSGQNAPFKEIIDHLKRLVITMWLGSDLATMSSQDGAGASLQGESAAMLEDDDCQLLEETLAATVSSFVIRYYFGNVEPAAYLQFQRTDRSDKKAALEILGMTADQGRCGIAKGVARSLGGSRARRRRTVHRKIVNGSFRRRVWRKRIRNIPGLGGVCKSPRKRRKAACGRNRAHRENYRSRRICGRFAESLRQHSRLLQRRKKRGRSNG